MSRVLILLTLTVLTAACAGDRSSETGKTEHETSTYVLQVEEVPQNLRHLVPLAETWGIGDDVERAEFIERSSVAERRSLLRAVAPHQDEISTWLDSFGTRPMTDEAAAFMYMQLAVEEMRSY